jgi:hypothetical protein
MFICPFVGPLIWTNKILSYLILYYINDIPTGLDSTIRLFADDTIAYLVKSNSDDLTLQRDLDKLAQCQWEQLWKMAFHQDKCNVLTISRNKTPVKFKYSITRWISQVLTVGKPA